MESMIVVGAGLVGSLLSVYLAKAGFRVSVYERSRHPREWTPGKGRSINITLCERGFQALDRVGAGNGVRALCVPCYGRVIHTRDGEQRYQSYGNQQEAIYSIRRHDLNRFLLEFAEKTPNIDFYFDKRCLDLDLDKASLEFQDTKSGEISIVQGDRIFAADGAFSIVRQKMQRLPRFNFSQEYWGQGYREFVIPEQAGSHPALLRNAIHVWPRDNFMLIGFPNPNQTFTLTLHLPFEGPISHESLSSAKDLKRLFQEYFPDILPLIEDGLSDSADSPVGTMVTIKSSPWKYQDKVVLIGDSCHAIFPSYGQGANAGFEDCRVLSQCIERYPGEWLKIFEEYERSRKQNLDVIADLCYDHFNVLWKEVGKHDFFLRDKIEKRILDQYPGVNSLYYNISFTNRSYSEAVRVAQEHEKIMQKIKNHGDATVVGD